MSNIMHKVKDAITGHHNDSYSKGSHGSKPSSGDYSSANQGTGPGSNTYGADDYESRTDTYGSGAGEYNAKQGGGNYGSQYGGYGQHSGSGGYDPGNTGGHQAGAGGYGRQSESGGYGSGNTGGYQTGARDYGSGTGDYPPQGAKPMYGDSSLDTRGTSGDDGYEYGGNQLDSGKMGSNIGHLRSSSGGAQRNQW
ncbi:hypothetical protein BO70DRAFT_358476 [Aspergillus heteromorphus CBS 117.55]|uniref:Uncharacterized protein n=1 Tax=Aspergillus heteromorphus CBS 117.55 TaxID=1448321 RepID=A0A317WXC1_9EURO|nr:uncharacterized protein BO70DRAFT_358476 [Aspergillus heteromorphus CBS 117.55]PWY91039.1 hypothetical protein BO70DRAFT_358476 [Aspergillus heteromorphus CBS 117.55]